MKRIGGWLGGGSAPSDAVSQAAIYTPAEELKQLEDALKLTRLVLNDELEEAERLLKQSDSPFHKLGLGFSYFLQSIAGFEKDIMAKAIATLGDCETTCAESLKRALKDPSTTFESQIYPTGSLYSLGLALSQLMGAIGGIWNENLGEAFKGLFKLRKAFATFQSLKDAEDRYIKLHCPDLKSGSRSRSATSSNVSNIAILSIEKDASAEANDDKDDDSDLDFHDAEEEQPSVEEQKAIIDDDDVQDIDFHKLSNERVDVLIHTGTALCLGMVNVILSLIPPGVGKVLAIFSFKGDRKAGMKALWSAANEYENLLGGIASVAILSVYNAAIAPSDIITTNEVPYQKMLQHIEKVRIAYPKSQLFVLEQARTLASDRQIREALTVLATTNLNSPLKASVHIAMHEKGLNEMHLHLHEESARTFLSAIDINEWNHNLYYYGAACNYIELYHQHHPTNPTLATTYADKTTAVLAKLVFKPRKGLFKGPSPLDTFLQRKIAKWNARAARRKCSLVDAIPVSPAEELGYAWGGYRRMIPKDLEESLAVLGQWEDRARGTEEGSQVRKEVLVAEVDDEMDPVDDRTLRALLRAAVLRNAGRVTEAKELLEMQVLSVSVKRLKACASTESSVLPCGHYELACCLWEEAGRDVGREVAEREPEEREELLKRCRAEIEIAAKWESHEMSARLGLKIASAREALSRCGV